MNNGMHRKLDGLLYADSVPGESLDWSLDYVDEFKAGETVATSTWVVPAGVTAKFAPLALVPSDDGRLGTTTTVWLTTGAAGSKNEIKNTVVTSAGRTFVRMFYLMSVARLS